LFAHACWFTSSSYLSGRLLFAITMTKIRKKAFANRIEEYLFDSKSFNEKKFNTSLYTVTNEVRTSTTNNEESLVYFKVIHGLCFSEHMELVMILLDKSYKELHDFTNIKKYSSAIAEAMQTFAEPIPDGDYSCFPYPYFLLHGLTKVTLPETVAKLEKNGRIIHETLAKRDEFISRYGGPIHLGFGIKMLMEEGATDDFFGICCYITKEEEEDPHGTDSSYIAKISFLLDTSNKEIYVITIQGQRVNTSKKNRSRDYARLAAKLEMDPRSFVLSKVCEIGKKEHYEKIRVIRPTHHPMFIDHHFGFMAGYEPIIRQAGIHEENGCYLEGNL